MPSQPLRGPHEVNPSSAMLPDPQLRERRRVMLAALPLVAATCLAAIPVLAYQGGGYSHEMLLYGGMTALLVLLFALLWWQRVAVMLAAAVLLGSVALLIGVRLLVLLTGDYFNNPANCFFMPVYAALPGLYLFSVLLLPLRISSRLMLAVWLLTSVWITIVLLPYWGDLPRRSSLVATLTYLWFGHPIYIALFTVAADQRLQTLNAYVTASAAVQESEVRFRSLFNQAAVGMAMLDEQGHWLLVNQRLCEITGYTRDELLGIDYQTITHPDDLDEDQAQGQRLVAGEIDSYRLEKRYIRKDGRVVWVLHSVGCIRAPAATPPRFVSVIEDISERKAAEAAVHRITTSLEAQIEFRTARLEDAMQQVQARNAELALVTEMSGLLSAARDLSDAANVVAHYLPLLLPRADGALYFESTVPGQFSLLACWGDNHNRAASFGAADCWSLRRGQMHRVERADDPLRCSHTDPARSHQPHLCVPLVALGDTVGVLELAWGRRPDEWAPETIMLRTLAEQIGLAVGNVRLREELRRQVIRDPLTGLYNRRFLDEYLQARVAEWTRSGSGFALVAVDLDHFKRINDRYGHEAGDLVLREAAALLVRSARAEEAAFRLGGEEFLLVLRSGDAEGARIAGERIREALQQLRLSHNDEMLPPVTGSLGVALAPLDGKTPAELLLAADEALYHAKNSGRNRVCLRTEMSPPTTDKARRSLA